MTTATRRLRRASVAGLATVATVGGMLLATGGTAFAVTELTVTDQAAGAATLVFPGATGAPVQDLQVDVANSFAIGDTLTFQLQGGDCSTTNKGIGYANTPTAPVTGPFQNAFNSPAAAGASNDTAPTFTVATSASAGACSVAGVKDLLTLTFTNSSTGTATDDYTITITGAKINVGSAVASGTSIIEQSTNGTPVAVGDDIVAKTINTKLSTSAVVGSNVESASTAIGTVTMGDVGGKVIDGTKINVTLDNNAKFVKAGSLTGPTGVTYALDAGVTLPATTVTFDATGTIPNAANTYTLSGATINTPTAGDVTATATDGSAASIGDPNGVRVAVAADATHLGGLNRYGTAAAIFEDGFAGATEVVIASGANFPDALSANVLARALGTGILLTEPTSLPQETLQELKGNPIETVYIVGGTAAVSADVQSQIEALHVGNDPSQALINVIRVAGADRYATNNAVNLTAFTSTQSTAIVASGANFPDALAAGAVAYGEGWPLILTDPNTLSDSAKSTMVNLGVSKVYIIGGTAAVSSAVETSLGTMATVAYRVQGADRTQTAEQVAKWATAGLDATSAYAKADSLGFSTSAVFMARGDNFADALSAGPDAGGNGQVILLTADPNTLGAGVPAFFSGKSGTIKFITIPGLAAAVSGTTVTDAIAALQ